MSDQFVGNEGEGTDDRRFSRRSLLGAGAAVAGALALPGLGGAFEPAGATPVVRRRSASTAPLRIGAISSTSGPFEYLGNSLVQGFQLFLDLNGGKLGGRPATISVGNSGGDPTTALQLAEKYVSGKYDLVFGTITDPEALAVAPVLNGAGIPLLVTGSNTIELATTKRLPFVYRTAATFYQMSFAPSRWFHDHIMASDVWVMTWNFTGGAEVIKAVQQGFASRHGKIAGTIQSPFPVTGNFQPYFSKLRSNGAKGVIAFYGGSDGISFLKQWKQFGLGKLPLLGLSLADPIATPGTASLDVGVYGCGYYLPNVANHANSVFTAAYRRRFKSAPTYFSESSYAGAQLFDAVLHTTHGITSDKAGLKKALAKPYHLATPAGTWVMDPKFNSPTMDAIVWKNVAKGSGSAQKLLGSFPTPAAP